MVPPQTQRRRGGAPRYLALIAIFAAAAAGPLIIGWMGERETSVAPLKHERGEPGVGPTLTPRTPADAPSTPSQQPSTASGQTVTVLDQATLAPIRGAVVTPFYASSLGIAEPGGAGPAATTGDEGTVLLKLDSGRAVVLHASAQGYARGRVHAVASQPATVLLARAASVSGRVKNVAGEDVPKLSLRAVCGSDPMLLPSTLRTVGVGGAAEDLPVQVLTAEDGSFTFPNLRADRPYAILVDSRDWVPVASPKGSRSGLVSPPTDGVELLVDEARYARIRLLNARTRAEIGVGLRACDVMEVGRRVGSAGGTAAARLRGEIAGLGSDLLVPVRGSGPVRLGASAYAFMPLSVEARSLTWAEAVSGQHDTVFLEPLLPVLQGAFTATVLVPGGSIPPTVPDGDPLLVVSLMPGEGLAEIPGAPSLRDLPITGRYEPDGQIRFDGVPGGRRSMHLDLGGIRSRRQEVELDLRKPTSVQFEFAAPRILTVEVRSRHGPLLDAALALEVEGGDPVLQPAPFGSARYVLAPPKAPFKLTVWRQGYATAKVTVDPDVPSDLRQVVVLEEAQSE